MADIPIDLWEEMLTHLSNIERYIIRNLSKNHVAIAARPIVLSSIGTCSPSVTSWFLRFLKESIHIHPALYNGAIQHNNKILIANLTALNCPSDDNTVITAVRKSNILVLDHLCRQSILDNFYEHRAELFTAAIEADAAVSMKWLLSKMIIAYDAHTWMEKAIIAGSLQVVKWLDKTQGTSLNNVQYTRLATEHQQDAILAYLIRQGYRQ